MPQPVVHFEVTGQDPVLLRAFFTDLFDWEFDTDSPVAEEVSDEGQYGFVSLMQTEDGTGIRGGVGGGPGRTGHAMFYVAVDDVEAALQAAVRLGGTRILGPAQSTQGGVVIGHFTDPEGHLIGVAGGG